MRCCDFDGCQQAARQWARYGEVLCEGHYKQRLRGKPLTPLRDDTRDAWAIVTDAALALAEVESDEEWDTVAARFRWAMDAYARRKGGPVDRALRAVRHQARTGGRPRAR